jgi:hypothetical protein
MVATTSWSYAYQCVTTNGTTISLILDTFGTYSTTSNSDFNIETVLPIAFSNTLNPGKYLFLTGGHIQCTSSSHTSIGNLIIPAIQIQSNTNLMNMFVPNGGGIGYSYASQSVMPNVFQPVNSISYSLVPYFILA